MKTAKSFKVFAFVMILFTFIMGVSAFSEKCSDNPNEYFVEGFGCVEPKVKISKEVGVYTTTKQVASSIGTENIDPIKIFNPWASQGQPVIVQFTLENVGDQYGYPYDQISLNPDSYLLMMSVDADIGVRDKGGRFVDLWEQMSSPEKFSYLMCQSSAEFKELASKTIGGQVCSYVDAQSCLSSRMKDIVEDKTGGRSVYTWECLKIVDLPFFAQEIKQTCQDSITAKCLTEVNTDFGNSVSDTVMVVLASEDETPDTRIGECIRPYNNDGFWGGLKQVVFTWKNWNIIKCNVGNDGIKAGEKVTFEFVVIVPADAPVVNPKELENLEGVDLTEGDSGFTESVACKDDSNAQACHSIYGAVYPMATKNFIQILGSGWKNNVQILGCSISGVFSSAKTSDCLQTKGFQPNTVGEPLWQGAGIFYIVGAVLKGSITMILWASYIAGGLVVFGLGRKK